MIGSRSQAAPNVCVIHDGGTATSLLRVRSAIAFVQRISRGHRTRTKAVSTPSVWAAMNRSRITDDMFARIPAFLAEGLTKAEIAAMYGVSPGTLVVRCSQRGISLRRGGTLPKRTKLPKGGSLTLPDEPLPLSDGVLKSLSEAARAMGKDSTARLVSDLLEKIASDGLYKAVLDEEAA